MLHPAILFRSLDEEHPAFGVNPFPNPLACYIGAWDWGKYLGDEAIERGVDVCVSTWEPTHSNSMPAMAKSGANYMNSQLIKMEALLNGFAEGIALDDRGYVSEGSGENIFLVTGDIVLTPPLSSSILPGITRDSVIQICQELGITVKAHHSARTLYVADELFFTGTAAEVTPIRSVDRITVGSGGRGPITEDPKCSSKSQRASDPPPATGSLTSTIRSRRRLKTMALRPLPGHKG